MFGLALEWTAPPTDGVTDATTIAYNARGFICHSLSAVLMNMKIRITMNGKAIGAQEAARDLLHPDKLAEKILQQKTAGVVCDEHPIQCRHLRIKVAGG